MESGERLDLTKSEDASSMLLTESVRESTNSLVSNSVSSGFQLGIRNFSKPHLGLRLGLFWAILDPLLRAAVFSFLMIVIRADTTPESLVIGIFTITALNNPFSSSMNSNLKDEPFPLSHTPTLPIIISKITQDALMAIFIGLTSGTILVIFASVNPEIVLYLPVGCAILSFIGSGLGMLLAPLVTAIKDLSKLVSYILLLGFFLQCVLFPYSITTGLHRDLLYWMPHTIIVEWCRAVSSNSDILFSFEHTVSVLLLWTLPALYGFSRFKNYRWRATTWS